MCIVLIILHQRIVIVVVVLVAQDDLFGEISDDDDDEEEASNMSSADHGDIMKEGWFFPSKITSSYSSLTFHLLQRPRRSSGK